MSETKKPHVPRGRVRVTSRGYIAICTICGCESPPQTDYQRAAVDAVAATLNCPLDDLTGKFDHGE